MYGPTEATVATTSIHIDAAILEKYSPLPVGRVMPGTKIFIVDENGAELPANERGEIIITGPNVSPGYAGRPDLTARAFFEYHGLRAYKTGDLGRFRDSLLFFEGRIDDKLSSADTASNSATLKRICARCRRTRCSRSSGDQEAAPLNR
jgi:Non-ribosomal peptide synthetase modules and related proteins